MAGSQEGMCPRCLLAAALRHPGAAATAGLPAPGDWIGSYRVLSLLGEGGMGLVYLAEQDRPIARQVAVKIIKLGMDTRAVLARFQSEQQALALMDHPSISQVFEAGSTAEGRPYFAMEYVPGVPITDYCDRHNLGTRQRLELFLQAAGAVQHAHQKGVIHRDLKPSNILITDRDGAPVLKIIDFGLAKATEKQFAEETLFTEAGVLIGTPEYMSPEQALGARDIDTRTDIYSLGVLLYELLVGTVPFDSKTLRAGGYDEIRRIIREDDPPLPTSRLQSLGPEAAQVASRRSTDAIRLRKELSGDLDWIAMKALEKESSRRYPSASEMAADIQRHLLDEPVSAGLAGPVYRCRKFIRKHRFAVAGAAAVLLSGVAIFSAAYIGVRHERTSAVRASYRANVAAAELLLREHQPGEAREHLETCAPELRNWEWRYLWRETDTSLARMRPQGEFRNAPFPSTIGFAGSLICWNTQTTVECWDGPSYSSPVIFKFRRVLAMSQDAELAVTDDGGIRVVEVISGRTLSICGDCKADSKAYYAVFSPDKSRVAMPSGSGTIVWEVRGGRTLAQIPAEDVLAFSPDGAELALGNLEVWSVAKLHKVASLRPGGDVASAAFSPDGRRLVAGSREGSIRVWNLQSPAEPAVLAITGPEVEAVAFSPDSRRVAATGYDRAVRIWLDDKLIASLAGFNFPTANSVAFSPDGKRLAAGWECCELAVWDATSYGGQFLPLAPGKATAMAVSSGSALMAAGFEDGRVALYGLDGTMVRGWPAGAGRIGSMAFSPDGKHLLTGGRSGAAQVWNVPSGAPGVELRGHSAAITAVAYSPDGRRVASGSTDRTARLWDADSGRSITITLRAPVNSVSFSPDGRGLLTAAGDTSASAMDETPLRLWDASTGSLLQEFKDLEPCAIDTPLCPAFDASFSPDGRRLVATFPTVGKSIVWNARTGAVISRLRDGVFSFRVTFSPDGSRIVTASWDSLRIWDAVQYERLLAMPLDEGPQKLAFTSDGSLLLGLTESGVRMWQSLGPTTARRP